MIIYEGSGANQKAAQRKLKKRPSNKYDPENPTLKEKDFNKYMIGRGRVSTYPSTKLPKAKTKKPEKMSQMHNLDYETWLANKKGI